MRNTIASLSLSVLAAASAAASPANAATRATAFPPAVDILVSRVGTSPASFQTFPNARCVLSAEGTKAKITVYADDRGAVPFHFTPSRGGSANGSLNARCDARGSVMSTAVRIHPVARTIRPLAVGPAFNARPLVPRGVNPATLSEIEVKRLQLPPRPDAGRDPQNYAQWLRAVTTPVTRVGGTTILRPDVIHGPLRAAGVKPRPAVGTATKNGTYTSPNWSGIVDFGGNGQFAYWVAGKWTVPAVTTNFSNSAAYSSIWDGIDGDGSGDVIQNGTEQDSYALWFGTFSFYSAWYEFYPDGGSTTLPNFSVNPGDQIYAASWLCYDGNGQRYGCYYMENMTQGEASPVYSELGQQPALFAGNSAEWIVERPTINGNLYPLAQFGFVPFSWEHVYDSYAGVGRNSCDENQNSLWMYNGLDLLSTAFPTGCDSSLIFWDAFQ